MLRCREYTIYKHWAKSVPFSALSRSRESPSPNLTGKVGAPPTLTKIEKEGGIGVVGEKSQLFYVFKTPFRGCPSLYDQMRGESTIAVNFLFSTIINSYDNCGKKRPGGGGLTIAEKEKNSAIVSSVDNCGKFVFRFSITKIGFLLALWSLPSSTRKTSSETPLRFAKDLNLT